ncbi:MAG: hypothetical protein AAF224_00720 [Pseudomonadota bacterium]
MKKLLMLSAVTFSAAALAAPALANDEMIAQCQATMEAEGRDGSGCACLVEEVTADPALVEEFASLGDIADADERYEAASDAAKAAMDACTR